MNCRETFAECWGHAPYAHRLYVGDVEVEGRNYGCRYNLTEEPCYMTPPPAYAWPGGYPIIYYEFDAYGRNDGYALCACCAGKLRDTKKFVDGVAYEVIHSSERREFKNVIVSEIFYEGAEEECGDCGNMIASAYGDPEENEKEAKRAALKKELDELEE